MALPRVVAGTCIWRALLKGAGLLDEDVVACVVFARQGTNIIGRPRKSKLI